MLKLRGHHFICLNFYEGQGYPEAYRRAIAKAVSQLKTEGALVVMGGDDVCKGCPDYKGGLCAYSPGAEWEISALDELALRLLGLEQGSQVTWNCLQKVLERVFPMWYKFACLKCEWKQACQSNEAYRILLPKTRKG